MVILPLSEISGENPAYTLNMVGWTYLHLGTEQEKGQEKDQG